MAKPSLKQIKDFNRRTLLVFAGFLGLAGITLVVASYASLPIYTTNWAFWGPRIKGCESGSGPSSGGNYTAQNRTSTASGAYQFLDSTWGGFKGYEKARLAPPEVQEERAVITFQARGTGPWLASYNCWRTDEPPPPKPLPTVLTNKDQPQPDLQPLVPGAQDITQDSKNPTLVDTPPAEGDVTLLTRVLAFLRLIGVYRF